ncbi:MAG: TRAP transporter fused permease subunit [Deltaproteobacteria bacterium]|nr:TRAP transporter fused permease subunit [Deltaproteobacteria bacterium]
MVAVTWREYLERHKGYRGIIAVIAVALVLFQLYTGLFGSLEALKQRAIHLGFGLALVFLVFPTARNKDDKKQPGWLDLIFVLASVAAIGYILWCYDWVNTERFSLISPLTAPEKILGVAFILVVLEATRRMAGNAMVIVALVFLAYPFVSPYLPGLLRSVPMSWMELLDFQYLGTSGVFGTPVGVSATDIALYIIFGAILVRSGGTELINNLAAALTGNSRGGPAKVAVVASSLMGTISGSGTANVATVGVVTIPMMKKAGYPSVSAGAIEAVASTGGQIMPPVMGAAAFVMSAFTGIPYITICRYAIFPAILYYAGLFAAVHLQAVRYNIRGIKSEITLKETLRNYGHMLIPIFALIITLFVGFTPRLAAGVAVVIAVICSQLRVTTRLGFWGILEAFEDGAKGLLIVIVATATAGIIVGVIDLTSLGQRLGAGFVYLAGGQLVPALVLGMLLAILLGMGMPTTPAYIIQASTVIPALIHMGLPVHVAHMFAFYFCCLSLITPPVAITAYAASAIAGADMWKTGWVAFRLGLAAYIVPFMFVFGQSLLLVGTAGEIMITVVTALVGVCFLAVAGEGYLWRSLSPLERVIALVTALLLIAPSVATTIPGVILGGALLSWNYYRRRENKESLIVS